MSEKPISRKRRSLPHWTLEGTVYFITFRLAHGTLDHHERSVVLDHLRSGNLKFYNLAGAVIMPDHVHLLLKPIPPYNLSQIMKGIKGVSSHKINTLRQTTGTVWQIESWDRIVRDADDFMEKLTYMADNPVKSELVRQVEEYPFGNARIITVWFHLLFWPKALSS